MTHQTIKTILLIEENPQDARLACQACEDNQGNYAMIHVFDGNQALDYLHCRGDYAHRDREKEPSLILLNMDAPIQNALRILKELRTHTKTQTLPVILLSSAQKDLEIAKAYEHGANSYIEKPRSMEEFAEVIDGLTFYWFNLVTPPPVQKCP